ncbi:MULTISPECIES: histidine kinase dimerization/phospho-acceptor domain-containing protein [unclassified Streptomyces]|uniref:histidine kinase dimerization/phospho-acceptor domain-containing protein n=1 Tax=unclassified Streptomyces TaxID=2593676 RepID=UPI00386F5691
MLERLEAAGIRHRRFIADATHELRSPLAVLRTQLEVAHTHPDPKVRDTLMEGALQDTERLQALSADLLLLARLDDARGCDDGGTGLGLSIALDIAALHGGTITVQDTSDGIAFRTRLISDQLG